MSLARGQPLPRPPVRARSYLLAFGLIAAFLILAHGPLLDLPYYWDEIGQFIPAALDIFRASAWIPVSTVPNVHPPGLMAYLALVWSVFGYSILATRIAMLLLAAFGALVTFLLAIELSRGSTGTPAFTALALLCLSPLFFAQSMLAQLDMPAMTLSLLALLFFLQNRYRDSAITCAVLVLIKETGAFVPALFACWILFERRDVRRSLWFLLPFPGLLIWLLALHHTTGHWFGNSAFTSYNLREPLNPVRFILALARRVYYVFFSTGHVIGTIALLYAFRRVALLKDRSWRIAWSFVFVQILVVSFLGGAVLERYILPALPVVYIAFAASLRALMPRMRQLTLAALVICLIAANFINPPYPFPFENNLAFVTFVRLEQDAISQVSDGLIASTFPVSNALSNPDFGFVQTKRNVLTLADFDAAGLEKLKAIGPDTVLIYRRTWDPLHLLDHPGISAFLARWYGYQPEYTPEQIAAQLSMRIARRWTLRGQSFALLARRSTTL